MIKKIRKETNFTENYYESKKIRKEGKELKKNFMEGSSPKYLSSALIRLTITLGDTIRAVDGANGSNDPSHKYSKSINRDLLKALKSVENVINKYKDVEKNDNSENSVLDEQLYFRSTVADISYFL